MNWCCPSRTTTRGGSMTSLTRVYRCATQECKCLRSLVLVALSPIRDWDFLYSFKTAEGDLFNNDVVAVNANFSIHRERKENPSTLYDRLENNEIQLTRSEYGSATAVSACAL